MATMSDSTKRAKVPKPAKKSATKGEADAETGARKETGTETAAAPVSTDDDLIDIPHVKKKKERHVKTEADIAAKQERKRLRKEAEQAKREAKLAKKGLAVQKAAIQNKVPKWKQFMKNTTEGDNAEKLKDTSYKVKGDDGSSDDDDSSSDSDSSDNDSKREKSSKSKRQLDDQSESNNSSSKSKKAKQVDDATLATLDTSIPGLAYLVEWKRSRTTWKFQKLRQIWLLNHMYDDHQIPDTHWDIFLEYIHDLKGAARDAAVQDAKKIVEAPEPEEEDKDQDQEMKEPEAEEESTIPLSEEEKAAEEASKQAKIEAKRVAKVKSSRALDLLKVLA
ncbi:hypothetical protein B0O80DRAFT_487915 [Mortierella sp. GBAus27b]|nr:hypothetical protein B0O80DRAFT_487915 [Mortierella sp. GBAus27b]